MLQNLNLALPNENSTVLFNCLRNTFDNVRRKLFIVWRDVDVLMFLLTVMFLLTDVRTVVNKNYRCLENLNEDLQLLWLGSHYLPVVVSLVTFVEYLWRDH